jgi:hypothetical protein
VTPWGRAFAGGRAVCNSLRACVAACDTTGPAGIVFFHFKIPDMGEILMFQTHTPLTPMLLQTNFRYFADENIPRALVSYVVRRSVVSCRRWRKLRA